MKLHLPKALFTAVIAAFAVSQTAWADTYNLLESGDNWSFEGRSPLATYSNGVVTSSANQWKQSLSTYTLGRQYYDVGADGTLSFTFTYNQTGGEGNSILNVALVGREQVLAFGSFEYAGADSEGGGNSLGWGTSTDTSKEVYHNGTLWDASTVGSVNYNRFSASGVDATRTQGLYTYTGTVVKNDEGNYLLDLSVTVGEGASATTTQYLDDVNLGASFNIQRVAFAVDGASGVPLSTLSITGALVGPPTYVTSVAAGSTDASSASWAIDGQGVNYGDIALTDGSVVLDISGAAEGSTVVLDAGTNVLAIDVSTGSVTLQSSGSITAQELVAKDGASVTIDSDLTASSVAGVVSVASGATLTMQEGDFHTITGAGNITLDADATVGNNQATQATGKLTINSGKTLKVGDGTQQTASIASFSSVDLNGGTLRMHNNGSTVNNLTVGSESTLHVEDAAAADSTTLLAGTTTLNAELNVTSGYKGTLTVDKLTGTGNLDIDAGNNGYADTLLVNINKLDNYSGVIGYKASGGNGGTKANNVINIKNTTDDNAYGAINIGGLTLENSGSAFATANLDMGRNDQYGANSLGAVSISGGSVLSMFNRGNNAVVNMSSLTVTGAATVQTKRDANCYQGIVNIESLVNGGDDAATLNLVSGSKATAIMAYNLNGGDGFTGTINVKGDAASGGSRRVALNINAENAAKGAVINFLDATTDAVNDADENYTALGLGSNATVAGLGAESVGGAAPVLTTNAVTITGYKIKANEKNQFATRDDADTDTSARTLTINAADSKEYSVKANVGANVNLTQSGAGTQNISGDQSAMNGTLEASAGALNITNTGAAMSLAGVKATGGIVQVSDATNAVTMADMTVSNGGQVKGNSMTVTNSMTISNSDAFDLTGALVMSGATVNLSGFTLDTTTAQDTYVYTLGTAAGGITADASISFTGINVDGYTATLAAMATVPTAGAAMLADTSATNNYLVLTLVKDAVTPPPATELTQVTVTGAQGYDSASNVLTLTTNIADIADYSGIASTLAATVTDSLWEQLVELYGIGTLVNIALVDGAGNYFDLDGADNADTGDDVALTINGIGVNTPAPTYSAVGNGAAVGPYVTSYIPEPTTGTLSILALAGLMIRRRRR